MDFAALVDARHSWNDSSGVGDATYLVTAQPCPSGEGVGPVHSREVPLPLTRDDILRLLTKESVQSTYAKKKNGGRYSSGYWQMA